MESCKDMREIQFVVHPVISDTLFTSTKHIVPDESHAQMVIRDFPVTNGFFISHASAESVLVASSPVPQPLPCQQPNLTVGAKKTLPVPNLLRLETPGHRFRCPA